MSHPVPDPKPTTDDPTGLHALVASMEAHLAKARAGDLEEYGQAREGARLVEVAARRLDVDLHDEAYRAQRDRANGSDRSLR